MPEYRFVGSFETVLLGLQNGVNAHLRRYTPDGAPVDPGQPDGSTVVAQPGDLISTDEPYENALLVEDGGPQIAATAPDAPARPDVPIEPSSPASGSGAPAATPSTVDEIL
jgi:hypothetical protein